MQGYRRKHSKVFTKVALFSLVFLFSCGSVQEKKTVSTFSSPPPEVKPQPPSPGSLFSGYENLFSDPKARNVGDVVTIKVYENLSGTGSVQSSSAKQSSFDINVNKPTVLGNKVPGSSKDPLLNFSTSPKVDFAGKGATARNARLIATISARVVKVYPNGDLYVVGEKVIRINDDVQVLRISGIVRPEDIAPDNSVPSSKVANMYVEYNGKGYMAENQRPGWLARFLMKIWPF
ncbi:flagellar L-ring protein precursor FlgH [Phorcysia thermohydrogeniphila]|uniref:Flagellar L-ring protein n=1 Tax=Phorcysia thermohydrogeniphila TaxID=936138 RepID=A0A4R1G7Y6_9BACT|nr:flagellar L-ring protein precursor FlgH [Phorcysia thermohydrogeniphila]